MKIRARPLLTAIASMLALASPSLAQSYPTRAITMIVPFAPGGPADVLGRLIGQKMGEDLGQQVIIDNRPGANTIIGAQAVAKAKPDGYTILLAIDGTLVMNPFLYSSSATIHSRISTQLRSSLTCPRCSKPTSRCRSIR